MQIFQIITRYVPFIQINNFKTKNKQIYMANAPVTFTIWHFENKQHCTTDE